MVGTVHQMDTSCFHILGSTKACENTRGSVVVQSITEKEIKQKFSVNPSSFDKRSSRIYRRLKNRRSDGVVIPSVDCPNSVEVQSVNEKEIKQKFSVNPCSFDKSSRIYRRAENRGNDGVVIPGLDCPNSVEVQSINEKEIKQKFSVKPCSFDKSSSRIYRRPKNKRSDGVVIPSLDCPNSVEIPNGEPRGKVGDHPGLKSMSNGAFKFSMNERNSLGRRKEINYSKKWASYGGCIPSILQALETVNDLDEALKPWEDKLSKKARAIILKEQTSYTRALEIFEWFKRKGCYELNVFHYNIMLKILGKEQKWDLMERLWNEMETMRIVPTNITYGTLIHAYSNGGFWNEALLWMERMIKQGIEPDEVITGSVLQIYKKLGQFEMAKQFFKDWSSGKFINDEGGTTATVNNATSQPSLSFGLKIYNILIDTYGKAGKLQEVSATFSQMLKQGLVPDMITFNSMIHICGSHHQFEEVASLMQKMEELRCPPNTITFNILISLHVKHDNINVAMSYFTKMKKAGMEPDRVTYLTLLFALSRRHMVVECEALVSEMDELGFEISESAQSSLTRMYLDAGMLQRSWSWFKRFHLAGNMSLECYSANIDAYGERGHITEAEKAFACCRENNNLSVVEYNVMIKAYGVGKNYRKACELFDTMERTGILPDRCSYNSLIQILSVANLPHIAKPYVRKMQMDGLICDCIQYCAVISSFVNLGQLEMAEELFQEMVGFGVVPDIRIYDVLINAFADVGYFTEAMRFVDLMRNSGLSENPVIFNSLIKLYTKAEFLKEAHDTYKLLQSSEAGPKQFASNCMMDLYSRHALVNEAEEIFEELKQKGDANEFSYAMMLRMYMQLGRLEEAVEIARQMRDLGLLTDLLSYNNVLLLYALDGRLTEVVETFLELINLSIQPDDYTFKALRITLEKCGVSKKAVFNLEVKRRRNAESGLAAWISTLSSIIDVDAAQHSSDKTRSLFQFHPFIDTTTSYGEKATLRLLVL